MKILLTFFSICLLSACSTAEIPPPPINPDTEIPLLLQSDKEDSSAANWLVDGFVEKQPYRFYLDTGAGTTSVAYDDFTSRYKTQDTRISSGAFAKQSYDLIHVPLLTVGPLKKANVVLARSGVNIKDKKNLLGMNILKNYALHFEFDQDKIGVIGSAEKENFKNLLPLQMGERSHPYVTLTFPKNITANGVWDTGAGVTAFDLAYIKKHPELFKKIGSSTGKDSTGTEAKVETFKLSVFTIGGQTFKAVTVAGIDLSVPNSTIKVPMDFILGYNVLKQANWYFDFPNKKWSITKMN